MNQAPHFLDRELFECPYFTITYEEPLIHMTFKIAHMDIAAARQIVITRLKCTDILPYPVLFNTNSLVKVDEEAYHYLAGPHGTKRIECAAFLLSNEINHLIFEVWKQFEPAIPVRAFGLYEKEAALRWLCNVSERLNAKHPLCPL